MSYLDWHVGMKVVCIASAETIANMMRVIPDAIWPAHGVVYTIREIRDDGAITNTDSRVVVLLSEIDNSHFIGVRRGNQFGYVEPGFSASGFRPLQHRKTDISIFTAMLHDQRQKVPS